MSRGPGHVVVVGAGISGLTAGFRLRQRGHRVTVLERGDAVGGRMSSSVRDGYTINRAANILPSSYSAVRGLVRDLGLSGAVDDVTGVLGIPRAGRTRRLRSTGPGLLADVLTTDLLSPRAKARARHLLVDALRMRSSLSYANLGEAARFDTESAARYCDRRLDPELTRYLVEPIVRGLFTTSADRVSVVDFFFAAVNFVGSGFMQYRDGVAFLPRALAAHLDVETGAHVSAVVEQGDRVVVRWTRAGETSETVADAAVVATPATLVPGLVEGLHPRRREILAEGIEYGTTFVVHVALRGRPRETAMVVPVPEPVHPDLCVVTLDHNLSPTAAPPGDGLVSGYFLDERSAAWAGLTDGELLPRMLQALETVLPGITGRVRFAQIDRWSPSVVRSYPGMYARIAELADLVDPASRVQLAGDYLTASSTNGCAVAGGRAAALVADRLG